MSAEALLNSMVITMNGHNVDILVECWMEKHENINYDDDGYDDDDLINGKLDSEKNDFYDDNDYYDDNDDGLISGMLEEEEGGGQSFNAGSLHISCCVQQMQIENHDDIDCNKDVWGCEYAPSGESFETSEHMQNSGHIPRLPQFLLV